MLLALECDGRILEAVFRPGRRIRMEEVAESCHLRLRDALGDSERDWNEPIRHRDGCIRVVMEKVHVIIIPNPHYREDDALWYDVSRFYSADCGKIRNSDWVRWRVTANDHLSLHVAMEAMMNDVVRAVK
jgi:hypothetical protein